MITPLSAFEQTARTIVQVGQQGVIASLLRAEANALRIEACNEALTELISLFNVRPTEPPAAARSISRSLG